jgi:DNA polymerase-3 subunit delta'
MWPVIGHEWAVELLAHSARTHRLSHAYLFAGPPRVGKTTLAQAFTQAILCTGQDVPCGACRSCRLVQMGRHPDVHVVLPEDGHIKIEMMRELQRAVALSPVESRYRVCMISQMDLATPSAANSLLKTLEEPPSTVILVLTADRPELLLPTIVSRCQGLNLRPVPTGQIMSTLQERGVEGKRARLLGHLARGRVGWALEAAQNERVLVRRNEVLDQVLQLDSGLCTVRFAWAEQLSKRSEQVPAVLEILTGWWRDVLILASGSSAHITNVDREARIGEYAARYGVSTAKEVLRSIQDTAWRLEHNANLRLALEVLTLDMPGGQ